MKSIIALGVGLVVALAPAGTAFAAPAVEFGTGAGKAYGNCGHSSATGTHAPLDGGAGKGNGGHVRRGGKPSQPCDVEEAGTVETTTSADDGYDGSGLTAS